VQGLCEPDPGHPAGAALDFFLPHLPEILNPQTGGDAILNNHLGGPLATTFNEQLDQHGAWRREFALRLKLLSQWLLEHDMLDSAVAERLKRLEAQVRSDKVTVAFVAEFSRGKSEMINAIFFADYGRRIMPASAGRTTMCPTELAYDAHIPPCMRLLPIETRLEPRALADWRSVPERWTRVDLDVDDPQQLAEAFGKVADTIKVTRDQARALGFWNSQNTNDNPLLDANNLVEVPKWRHALINIAHPLLRQGLVIVDTPGLNAIGAEPELTVSLIPQAHAVVFILAADTGVTKSDLDIWREHLVTAAETADARMVVLNKIDTLWDELSTPDQIDTHIERQKNSTAEILGIDTNQVIAVSAQKALVGKVTGNTELLKKSGLQVLEDALAEGLLNDRQRVLQAAMNASITDLRSEVGRVINIRRRDLTEQMLELRGLQGKNVSVIKNMRSRISQEQVEFELGGAKIHAVRSVHLKLLKEIHSTLGSRALKAEMAQLTDALLQKGLKLGVKKAYGETFERLRANLSKVQSLCTDIQTMLTATFKQLNAEYGFSLQAINEPSLDLFRMELDMAERSHLQYLSISNVFKLAQPEFADRLVRALSSRVRTTHESALAEVELWSKSAAAQLDAQLRERKRNFSRRIEAIDRIQQAAGGLEERIAEIENNEAQIDQLSLKLAEFTSYLVANPQVHKPEVDLELA
jgi:hypothetical protein